MRFFALLSLFALAGCDNPRLRPVGASDGTCSTCPHTHDAQDTVSGTFTLPRLPTGHDAGLDSDLLDGLHASAFRARAEAVPWNELSHVPDGFADGIDDGLTSIAVSSPLTGSGVGKDPLGIPRSSAKDDGYLAAEDFRWFASKVDPNDPRLSDARDPRPGSNHYIQNGLNFSALQNATFGITGNGYVGGWFVSGGDLRVGNVSSSPTPLAPGWGRRLYLSGAPHVSQYHDSENSDDLFLARYNVASDRSELRIKIGDNAINSSSLFDKLVVGASDYHTNAEWIPLFSVESGGTVRAKGSVVSNSTPDVAETIDAAPDVEVADVVCADPERTESVRRCGDGKARSVLGVISDGSSAFLIQAHGKGLEDSLQGKPLVLAGRVPVKVTLQNGPIHIGDELALSDTPGKAMKCTQPGPVVGIALEPFDGKGPGTVLALIKVGPGGVEALARENAELRRRLERLERAVEGLGVR